MAISSTYTGNGSAGPFTIGFVYLNVTDVKVEVDSVLQTQGTNFTVAGSALTFTSGSEPANGAVIYIYRDTAIASPVALFSAGAPIKAADLNNNYTQIRYAAEEADSKADDAISTANTASTNASSAITTANSAVTTANAASTAASNAVTTANTAASDAATALSTANTAASDAASAVTTANTAAADAASAVTTANTASTNASAAVTTANTASTNASAAVTTANAAATDASNAVTTANAASAAVASKLPLAGGTMTGDIAMSSNKVTGLADPTAAQDGATKNYVDTQNSSQDTTIATKLPLAGGTMSGAINMGSNLINAVTDPVSAQDAATKNYVDTQNSTQDTSIAAKLPLAGGTMSGAIDMGSNLINNVTDPVSAQDAATKNYVDTANSTQDIVIAAKLPLSGGTMTGNIIFNSGQTISGYVVETSATGSAEIPAGTTLERDASPSAGYIRFNTTSTQFEGYNGTVWTSIGSGGGGGATGGGTDQWALEHDNTITTSYTISTGKNVISAGPLTINAGATITIPTGSTWVIV